jgi:hypothetical protein
MKYHWSKDTMFFQNLVVFGLIKLRMLIEKIHEDVGHFGEMQTFAKVNDAPPSSLFDPKRVQLCQNAK